MDVSSYLQVDVNGEEIFLVDKKIISSYSGRIKKLLGKARGGTRNLKVIFHDFPGGGEGFELISRFCYSNGKIDINPSNVSLLVCLAIFMEMNESSSTVHNLFEQLEKSLEEIKYWTWSELLVVLKHCQNLLPTVDSSGLLHKCVDSLVGRLALASEASPCPSTSSPDSSGLRLSTDTRSTDSLKNNFRATWWFEDLVSLNPYLVTMLTKSMVFRKFDHGVIVRFLFYYQKSRFLTATLEEKREIMETVVEMLDSLDQRSISCKSLFGILRVALNLSIDKCCRNKLENMIGLQLDQATLDNLLIPSPVGMDHMYDVNLVLRFIRSFLGTGFCRVPLIRMQRVANLMDLYIAEVSPDPCLKLSKFCSLIRVIPDSARESYDGIYHAMDMYLEAHAGLSVEEKKRLCYALNYEKLSSETCKHLAHNSKFPSRSAIEALASQQNKLKNLLEDTNQPKPFIDSPCSSVDTEIKDKKEDSCEQIVLYAGRLDISNENEKVRANLQGMQCRVVELEKICKKMQNQMSKMLKSRVSRQSNARSLPRLC
ncbi:BTB/POZ domain-containing protein [Heracleum sosnowskyi]|uniref:BTB/POZ domain-containing protein n=1 Tax=Heracleum sosnowskyi TaxID=360622 RepID=A0AAD8MTN4_9APIA|nr:BTB/POZ domain-containing protein [Heracleum sosnowskyi]